MDGVARDLERLGRVVTAGEGADAVVERHGGGEDLEQRPDLVDAERGAVEEILGPGAAGIVGVEIGQRDQRQHLARAHVHDDAGAAERVEIGDLAGELALEDVLQPHVDRQLHRRVAVLQAAVEAALDAGETGIVEPGEAQHMGGEAALGIDPLALGLEFEAGNAELDDRHLLLRRKLARQPDEALVGGKPGVKLVRAGLGQHGCQLHRGNALTRHLLRHGEERGGIERGGEQHAVAVDDVGARDMARASLAGCAVRKSPLLKPATSMSRPAITAKASRNSAPAISSLVWLSSSAAFAGPSGEALTARPGRKWRGRHGLSWPRLSRWFMGPPWRASAWAQCPAGTGYGRCCRSAPCRPASGEGRSG